MVKRIRPVTRVAKFESVIRRLRNEAMTERPEFPELQGGWLPLVDVYEKDDDIVVEVEVPGLSAREIVISLRLSRIEIRGMKIETAVKTGTRYLRLEREYGKFQRTVPLPCAADPDGATAYLENGILTVHLKKTKPARERDIIVKIQKSQD
jgi:HSP20 family protein